VKNTPATKSLRTSHKAKQAIKATLCYKIIFIKSLYIVKSTKNTLYRHSQNTAGYANDKQIREENVLVADEKKHA